jgi:metallophosphoesterase superfamily enzyme
MKFLHDCLLIKDTLVIGDLHIGYDERFGRSVGQV